MTEEIDLTRVAANVCIYWEDASKNVQLQEAGASGRCTATTYFSKAYVTCYNDGECNGYGTCRNCKAYNVAGLQISHKDTTHLYTGTFLYTWNDSQKKYLPVRQLSTDELADPSFIAYPGQYDKTIVLNLSGVQVPMNLAIYNLRAQVKKCCSWRASPFEFIMDRWGTLQARVYGSSQIYTTNYLTKTGTEYTVAKTLGGYCSNILSVPWRTPFTEENPTAYGCNGAKPECPYYTGPKWIYCIDSKMDKGDKISAQQVMELRYYSTDWSRFDNPQKEWNKVFKDPDLFAWTGEYAYATDTSSLTVPENQRKVESSLLKRVHIDNFTSASPEIVVDSATIASTGTPWEARDEALNRLLRSGNYPTLIHELHDVATQLKILWPKNTKKDSPYVFRTFRIGQNVIRLYVESPYITTIYAVNVTVHPQDDLSDADFIQYMIKNHSKDLVSYTAPTTPGSSDPHAFDVELKYNQGINVIRVFSRDPKSSTGEYLIDECYVDHQMYHAMVAQTKGEDNGGTQKVQPWIERFARVHCEAEILKLANNPLLDQVVWNTQAGGRLTMYPTETFYNFEEQRSWVTVGCSVIAVTFNNLKCSAVIPWKTFGTGAHGETLGMVVDRSGNPKALQDGYVPLKVVYWSGDGSSSPGNVVFVKPNLPTGRTWSSEFDINTDRIFASYVVTEYHEGPVLPEHKLSLKFPNYASSYIEEMSIAHSFKDDGTFVCDGSFLSVRGLSGTVERIYDIEDIRSYIYKRLIEEEAKAAVSFDGGGLLDDDIVTSGEIFQEAEKLFNTKYNGSVYVKDGVAVTLLETCRRLASLGFHEGDYTFMFIFKDETGRPIGMKTASMMLQSATVETRDVEIYYEWQALGLAWPIQSSLLLLARYNTPIAPAAAGPWGTATYQPRCGDHSHYLFQSHSFGEPGPMWFPYERCMPPKYHETDWNLAVKCQRFVEGFGAGYDGKRWDYWERMRGLDIFTTWVYGPIFLVRCVYRETSSTTQHTDEQTFTGYTRIRSCHPQGTFAKDREAVRISRHFLKRNLKVREEVVVDENDPAVLAWTDDFKQIVFTADSQVGTDSVVAVGSEQETPIWVHIADGVSIVDRTTSNRQHPFAHYLLQSVGLYNFAETFIDDDSNRVKLSDVLKERDLTSSQNRRTDGSLIYSPGEPSFFSAEQNYNDIVPVYKQSGVAWGWLERPKEPARGTEQITGITLYNPSVSVWRTDKESAVYTEEGVRPLRYTAPTFNDEGNVVENPTVSWADGPAKIINWYTGAWLDVGTAYDSTMYPSTTTPIFFGNVCAGVTGFIADGDGIQQYTNSITNDGLQTGWTMRGFGVDCSVSVEELPYSVSDRRNDFYNLNDIETDIITGVSTLKNFSYVAKLGGLFYVEEVHVTYFYGIDDFVDKTPIRYDIPGLDLFVDSTVGGSTIRSWVSSADYQMSSKYKIPDTEIDSSDPSKTLTADKKSALHKKVTYAVGTWAKSVIFNYGTLRADARCNVYKVEILYRSPEDRVEWVRNYEQRVNVSTGNTGTPDYREMLYYYSRLNLSYGADTSYGLLGAPSDFPSTKFTNRSIRDVILEYEYYDFTNTRFPYGEKTHPQRSPIATSDVNGIWSVPGKISICTKSRTLMAGSHKNDCSQFLSSGGTTHIRKEDVAINETSACAANVGDRKLDESVQECLFREARLFYGQHPESIFNWFWHPDERAFWEDELGVHLPTPGTLVLTSKIPEFFKMYENEYFGCSSDTSTPLHDGHLHPINKWRALGHRLVAGNPQFNMTCVDVVLHKIEQHMEDLYGTAAYGVNAEQPTWPYTTPRDRDYYRDNGMIESRSNYQGGAVGGGGIDGFVQQSRLAHGDLDIQQSAIQESNEEVYGGREEAARADTVRPGFNSNTDTGWGYWDEG